MERNYGRNLQKLREIDDTDRQILTILSKNARTKLTTIARQIGMSVDSTKKRMQKLEQDRIIFKYTISVDPDKLGFPLGVHVYVKLKDIVKEKYDALIDELNKNKRVIVLMSMLGEYDLFIVFLAKNMLDMDDIKKEIRQKFSSIIGEWVEAVVSRIYQLEEYRF